VTVTAISTMTDSTVVTSAAIVTTLIVTCAIIASVTITTVLYDIKMLMSLFWHFNDNSAARRLSVRLSRGTHQLSMVKHRYALNV